MSSRQVIDWVTRSSSARALQSLLQVSRTGLGQARWPIGLGQDHLPTLVPLVSGQWRTIDTHAINQWAISQRLAHH